MVEVEVWDVTVGFEIHSRYVRPPYYLCSHYSHGLYGHEVIVLHTYLHTISYHSIPYHTIPYHTISYHTISYRTISYHTIPYHTIPYHIILYHTIPYHTHTIPCHTCGCGCCIVILKYLLKIEPNEYYVRCLYIIRMILTVFCSRNGLLRLLCLRVRVCE